MIVDNEDTAKQAALDLEYGKNSKPGDKPIIQAAISGLIPAKKENDPVNGLPPTPLQVWGGNMTVYRTV